MHAHIKLSSLPDLVGKNVQTIAKLELAALNDRTAFDRLIDAVTGAAGSSTFIVIHVLWFLAWTIVNTSRLAFDPYPYNLLNVMLSLEAVVLTSVVLMTQNRMTRVGDRRAHLDLQVNLLAEQELTAMLHMLHGLCKNAGVKVAIRDERVEQLLRETDLQKIAVALDQELSGE